MSKEMTIKELANHLDVSYITALHMVHSGKIQGIKKGGHWRVKQSEVDRFDQEGNKEREEVPS